MGLLLLCFMMPFILGVIAARFVYKAARRKLIGGNKYNLLISILVSVFTFIVVLMAVEALIEHNVKFER